MLFRSMIFGLLFWRISKLVSYDRILREYLIIAGYGFLLLFSANQSTLLVLGPYPPFGLITITSIVLAAYMILIGIYTSAVLAATSVDLRKHIFGITKDAKVLKLLGRAELEKEVNTTVNKIMEYASNSDMYKNINHDIDEDDLKKYIESVISELRSKPSDAN